MMNKLHPFHVGDVHWVSVGISTRRTAIILDRNPARRRTRTVPVKFLKDNKVKWVHPHRVGELVETARNTDNV